MNDRQSVSTNGTLVVEPVQKLDAGTYTCMAGNKQGSMSQRTVNIRVMGKMKEKKTSHECTYTTTTYTIPCVSGGRYLIWDTKKSIFLIFIKTNKKCSHRYTPYYILTTQRFYYFLYTNFFTFRKCAPPAKEPFFPKFLFSWKNSFYISTFPFDYLCKTYTNNKHEREDYMMLKMEVWRGKKPMMSLLRNDNNFLLKHFPFSPQKNKMYPHHRRISR